MTASTSPLRRIYLDHAAATPLRAEVKAAMDPYLSFEYGNASAIHLEGQRARAAVEDARALVASTLAIKSDEIFFTGSGTESNNLAIVGHLRFLHSTGRAYDTMELITTPIEHPSIRELLPELERLGVKIVLVPVSETGRVKSEELRACLTPQTVLVSFSYVNSEIGVIQPVHQLVRVVRQYEREHAVNIFVHLDGAQAPLWLSCKLEALGVDALALDAGKYAGPKGVGILAVRKPDYLQAVTFGGGQERGLRPGTENVAGIVGAALGLELAQTTCTDRADDVADIRDKGIKKLQAAFPELLLNGPEGEERVANNINISLPGFDTEYAVVFLDAAGIAASTKSACAGAGSGVSHVVLACSNDIKRAGATLRFSLGEATKSEDLDVLVTALETFKKTMQTLTKD